MAKVIEIIGKSDKSWQDAVESFSQHIGNLLCGSNRSSRLSISDTMTAILCPAREPQPIYQKFLLFESEERVTAGRYTRVGLVPPEMTFERFSNLFLKLFRQAAKAYIVSRGRIGEKEEDYSVHLIRIFPSDVAFKLVKGGAEAYGAEIDPLHPVHIIKRLMIDKLGLISNLEFVASLKVEEPRTIAMKKVLIAIVDTRTSTYLLTKEAMGSITSRHPDLLRNMKNGNFDDSLISMWGCSTLSELTINIHNSYEKTSLEQKDIFKKKFFSNVERIVSSYKSRLSRDELALLTDAVFTVLDEFGTILSA